MLDEIRIFCGPIFVELGKKKKKNGIRALKSRERRLKKVVVVVVKSLIFFIHKLTSLICKDGFSVAVILLLLL